MDRIAVFSPLELLKAKYTRRWRGKDGKWNYEYARQKGRGRGLLSSLSEWITTGKRPPSPIAGGLVFRVMSREELDTMKSGYYSGAFWSSDPTEVSIAGDESVVLVAAKRTGARKFRGLPREGEDISKRHYHELERKELSAVIGVYESVGPRYAAKLRQVGGL